MASVMTQPGAPTRQASPRRNRALAWFFRAPITLYRLGLAKQLGRSTLLLTTLGRKTGLPRTTALNYVVDADTVYVLSGMGPNSDWLRNLRADPQVAVQIGERRFDGVAETIDDPGEHRRLLQVWAEQSMRTAPPPAAQKVMRWLGFDYTATVRKHQEEDPPPPIIALRPIAARAT